MEMVCIVCPNGCRLGVERLGEEIRVTGNKCKRGETFAVTELTNPTRSVTTTVRSSIPGYPTVSVRTNGEIPKDKIFSLIELCKQITLDKPLPIGSVVAEDLFGTGVDLITTTDTEVTNE